MLIPGGHGVVEDGVDGRVDVEHKATEVEDVEVELRVDVVGYLVRGDHDPHRQHLQPDWSTRSLSCDHYFRL